MILRPIIIFFQVIKTTFSFFESDFKEKIGFKKRESGFDDLEKNNDVPDNHEKSVRGFMIG